MKESIEPRLNTFLFDLFIAMLSVASDDSLVKIIFTCLFKKKCIHKILSGTLVKVLNVLKSILVRLPITVFLSIFPRYTVWGPAFLTVTFLRGTLCYRQKRDNNEYVSLTIGQQNSKI